jgi:hypothetical protein
VLIIINIIIYVTTFKIILKKRKILCYLSGIVAGVFLPGSAVVFLCVSSCHLEYDAIF